MWPATSSKKLWWRTRATSSSSSPTPREGSSSSTTSQSREKKDSSRVSPMPLATSYYRYYRSGDAHGFVHGLKYVVGPEAYARMVAAGITPETATDTQIGNYADHYFEYDTSNRVTLEKVKGGLYSYGYTYAASGDTSNNYNHWTTTTVETLPDGNQNIVYTNFAGQVVLKVFKRVSDGALWYEYYVYDSKGRVTSKAESSAVAGYSEGSPSGVLNVTLNTST